MYRPSESVIEHRLARAFPAKRLYELARRTGLVERRRKLDTAALFWALTLGFAMSEDRSIEALRQSYLRLTGGELSRYGGLILQRVARYLGYDPPDENLLELLLAAAVNPNPYRPSLIENVQHGAFRAPSAGRSHRGSPP